MKGIRNLEKSNIEIGEFFFFTGVRRFYKHAL